MNYNKMTCKELQNELKKRKLKSSGKKNVLIERLHENDNANKLIETSTNSRNRFSVSIHSYHSDDSDSSEYFD